MRPVWTAVDMVFAASPEQLRAHPDWHTERHGQVVMITIPKHTPGHIVPTTPAQKSMIRWFQIRHMEATQSPHLQKHGRGRPAGLYSDGEKIRWWVVRLDGLERYIWERDLLTEEEFRALRHE